MKKLLIMATLLASQCLAQKTTAYYHLDFTVKELEGGKVVSTRTYTTSVEPGGACTIRTGDKLPVQAGANTTYLDVGVNIDCNSVSVREDRMAMHVSADISSATSEGHTGVPPIVHQVKWSATVVAPVGKPTTIFSSEGASGKRQTQLELTATPIP